jgi:hypothetical protein
VLHDVALIGGMIFLVVFLLVVREIMSGDR